MSVLSGGSISVAASVVGLAVAAVLALGAPSAWAHQPGGGPERAGVPSGITIRLPDGRSLHFVSALPAHPSTHRPSHTPGHRPSGLPTTEPTTGPTTGPSAGPTSPPTGSPAPGGDPSMTGLPVPVVGTLFPSAPAGGSPSGSAASGPGRAPEPGTSSHRPSSPASRTPDGGAGGASAAGSPSGQAPVPVPGGQDAVQAANQNQDPVGPDPAVPPPLGPEAILPPDTPRAVPRAHLAARDSGLELGPHARSLGVGLALIGVGAALFGWRIRRL